MGQSPSDASPDEGPLPGDLATGMLFGARIAEAAKRLAQRGPVVEAA
jgi:NAD(P)H dehydrogenase (quinone)